MAMALTSGLHYYGHRYDYETLSIAQICIHTENSVKLIYIIMYINVINLIQNKIWQQGKYL